MALTHEDKVKIALLVEYRGQLEELWPDEDWSTVWAPAPTLPETPGNFTIPEVVLTVLHRLAIQRAREAFESPDIFFVRRR